jgi:hypothetical protein
MLDVASTKDLSEEPLPEERTMSTRNKLEQCEGARATLKRRVPQYFDRRQQLEIGFGSSRIV